MHPLHTLTFLSTTFVLAHESNANAIEFSSKWLKQNMGSGTTVTSSSSGGASTTGTTICPTQLFNYEGILDLLLSQDYFPYTVSALSVLAFLIIVIIILLVCIFYKKSAHEKRTRGLHANAEVPAQRKKVHVELDKSEEGRQQKKRSHRPSKRSSHAVAYDSMNKKDGDNKLERSSKLSRPSADEKPSEIQDF